MTDTVENKRLIECTKPISKCCNADASCSCQEEDSEDEFEGTHYFICKKCKKPCDIIYDK